LSRETMQGNNKNLNLNPICQSRVRKNNRKKKRTKKKMIVQRSS